MTIDRPIDDDDYDQAMIMCTVWLLCSVCLISAWLESRTKFLLSTWFDRTALAAELEYGAYLVD